jgi:hypothetical protein
MAKAGRGADQFPLRLPDGLRDRIKAEAAAANRSMNAEIIATLEREYPEPPPLDERLGDLLVTLGTLAAQAEGETPTGILSNFTGQLIETLNSIERGVWVTDAKTKEIASAALAKLKKGA